MIPPKMDDLFAKAIPNFLPSNTPVKQIINVTTAIITEVINAEDNV